VVAPEPPPSRATPFHSDVYSPSRRDPAMKRLRESTHATLRADVSPRDVRTLLIFYAAALLVCAVTIVALAWSLPAAERRRFAYSGLCLLMGLIALVTLMGVFQYRRLVGDVRAEVRRARAESRRAVTRSKQLESAFVVVARETFDDKPPADVPEIVLRYLSGEKHKR